MCSKGCSNLGILALGEHSKFGESAPRSGWKRYETLDGAAADGPAFTNLPDYDGTNPGWYKAADPCAGGHSWGYGNITKMPTCTEPGEKTYTCETCGETKKEIIAAGHIWGAGIVTKRATYDAAGVKTYTCGRCGQTKTETIPMRQASVGTTLILGNAKYKVTAGNKVQYIAPETKTASVSIPASVKIGGKNYAVTDIAANAFKGNTTLTSVAIGSNVTSIGKQAFLNCKKLKKIVIQSAKLTAGKLGAKAFKGISSKAVIKVPKAKLKAYKKFFKKKGITGKKQKIK